MPKKLRSWFSSAPVYGVKPSSIDREAGILRGMSVATPGEAKGHGVHLDADFIARLVQLGNERKSGVKVRFGHPSMSSTALGTFLGRAKNFRVDGGRALADLYLSGEAKETPNGDLWQYVLTHAENSPDMFGASIVFTPGAEYQRTPEGGKTVPGSTGTAEPDGPVWVECEALHAVDLVDDPAANPEGLFSSPWALDTFAGQVSEFLDLHPDIFEAVSRNPEIIEGFMQRHAAYKARRESVPAIPAEPDGPPFQAGDKLMENQKPTEPAPAPEKTSEQLQAEAAAQAVTADRERLKALRAEFPEDLEFAHAAHEKGWSLEQAKIEYLPKLRAALAAAQNEIAQLKKDAAVRKESSASPVGESLGADQGVQHAAPVEGKKGFLEAAEEYRKAKGCSRTEALAAVAKKSPELHKEYIDGLTSGK